MGFGTLHFLRQSHKFELQYFLEGRHKMPHALRLIILIGSNRDAPPGKTFKPSLILNRFHTTTTTKLFHRRRQKRFTGMLKGRGKVEYILYPGEGHGFRQAKHLSDALEREVGFCNSVFKLN